MAFLRATKANRIDQLLLETNAVLVDIQRLGLSQIVAAIAILVRYCK